MTAPRALCFLIPGDPATPTGGYRYDQRIVQALAASGWAVGLLRMDADWPTPDAAALTRAAAQIAGIADGMRVVADGLAFGTLADVVAANADRLRWVALVHHPLHLETNLPPALRQRLLAGESRALGHARAVVVTSERTAHDVAAMGVAPARISVVEPGTDACANAKADEATDMTIVKPAVAATRLLCVATVTPRKGHAVLLHALAGLMHLPWQLHCVGSLTRDSATAASVQALARDAGMAGRVVWHGEVVAGGLSTHYAEADLLVLASLHEGYGMVVAEALAAGLPVLASDAGALAQTLPPEAGWHVPAGDVPALQAALQRLISDPALRRTLASGAREAGRRLPGWPVQATRFAAVLDALP